MMAGSPPSKIVRVDNEDDEITNGFVDAKPIFDLWEDSDKNRDEDSCQ